MLAACVEVVAMDTTTQTTSSNKVRRDHLGGKRGDGHERQLRGERIRRADPERIRIGTPDPTLSGIGGLVPFGVFLKGLGVDRQLRLLFDGMKSGRLVVYPMPAQLRLLIDANAVGEGRVFGLEALAADPVFVKLAGGVVPSIDTVYRDLERFDKFQIAKLEVLMADHGLAEVRALAGQHVHVDIDTTVEPLFGHQDGALPGPNPRYHGRPSYHPLLAVVAETGTCIGAQLRPGDRGLGDEDASRIGLCVERVRVAVGDRGLVTARIDAGGDCTAILAAIEDAGARFIAKPRLTADLCGAIHRTTDWRTVDVDADGRPVRQVAEISFQRKEWAAHGKRWRVIAVRSREHDVGKQVYLWSDLDYTVQAYVTNDWFDDGDSISIEYNGRAEVEPVIGELKHAIDLGKVPSQVFNANHAAFLIKLLAYNLVRRYVRREAPNVAHWRLPWIRRVLFHVPARLVRSGRRWTLRFPPRPASSRLLC
jgi:hypothetical protein